jgi:autotransporter-associated beta strand protein
MRRIERLARFFLAIEVLVFLSGLTVPLDAQVVPVSNANDPSFLDPGTGDLDIDTVVSAGGGTGAQLVGYTSQNWSTQSGNYSIVSPIDFNGNTLFDDQGGNPHTYYGALSGTGVFIASGPSITLAGSDANISTGQYQVTGTLYLSKPSNVDAVAGPLIISASSSSAFNVVQLLNDQQIDPASVVTLNPSAAGASAVLRLYGNSNSVAGLANSGSGSEIVENEKPGAASNLIVTPSVGSTHAYGGVIRDGDVAGNGTIGFGMKGAGVQVLSGPLSYSGGTTVHSGTLTLSGTLAHASVAVDGGVVNGNGTIAFNPGEKIVVGTTGTFDASGGMLWNLANLSVAASPISLLDFTDGGSLIQPASLNSLLTPASAIRFSLVDLNSVIEAVALTHYYWNVDADGKWNNSHNWTTGVPNSPAGLANFVTAIAQPRTVTLDIPVTVGTMTFGNVNQYTLSSSVANSLKLNNSDDDSSISVSLGSHVIAASVLLGGNGILDVTVTPSSGTLTISGNIKEVSPGTGVMHMAGAGTLLMTGSNSFTVGLVVNSGTVLAGGGHALAGTLAVTVAAGATFGLSSSSDSQTIGSLNVQRTSGGVSLNGGTLNVVANGTANIYGLTGPGTLIVTTPGSATTTLGNNGAFTGNLTVNNGILTPGYSIGMFGSGAGNANGNS